MKKIMLIIAVVALSISASAQTKYWDSSRPELHKQNTGTAHVLSTDLRLVSVQVSTPQNNMPLTTSRITRTD